MDLHNVLYWKKNNKIIFSKSGNTTNKEGQINTTKEMIKCLSTKEEKELGDLE